MMFEKWQSPFHPTALIALLAGSLLLAACAPAMTTASPLANATMPAVAVAVPTSAPIPATPAPPASSTGTTVTFGPLTLVVPPGVASGASGLEVPRANGDEAAWWQKTPGHTRVALGDYYARQGTFHEPQILVYPAQAYAELVPAAFESIRRVNNILYGGEEPLDAEQLPAVPFFNAAPAFATHIQTVSFQNGGGVRFLSQYAQAAAPINNHELFYQFQGVARDGAYYIIAIFPIAAPLLAESGDAAAALPPGGIAPPDPAAPQADWAAYDAAVADLLQATPAEAFTPALDELDRLIASLQVGP